MPFHGPRSPSGSCIPWADRWRGRLQPEHYLGRNAVAGDLHHDFFFPPMINKLKC
jgi:hypothetical protein